MAAVGGVLVADPPHDTADRHDGHRQGGDEQPACGAIAWDRGVVGELSRLLSRRQQRRIRHRKRSLVGCASRFAPAVVGEPVARCRIASGSPSRGAECRAHIARGIGDGSSPRRSIYESSGRVVSGSVQAHSTPSEHDRLALTRPPAIT